jgi:CheY-like chemotaxis protein
VCADEARLGQVFINLLLNAAQAIPEGLAQQNEIAVALRPSAGGQIVVEVRDTGKGIPQDVLGRIFDPFFTTKPFGQGTGLGLSISQSIVRSLGGDIQVESEVGKGSVFRLFLPVAPPEPAAPSEPPPREPASERRSGAVLIVDDDPLVAKALLRTLAGHDVTVASHGKEALDLLLGGPRFDVIVCDLMMPVMTGMELHAELARRLPEVLERMVFITGGVFTKEAKAFLDQVPNHCLTKPFDPESLRELVGLLMG